jgi:hypothetical protein
MRGAQRQTATGSEMVLAQPLHRAWKANFVVDIINKQRLLSLPYGTGKRLADGQFGNQLPGRGLFQHVDAHDIALRIVQPGTQIIEVKNVAQRPGEIVE